MSSSSTRAEVSCSKDCLFMRKISVRVTSVVSSRLESNQWPCSIERVSSRSCDDDGTCRLSTSRSEMITNQIHLFSQENLLLKPVRLACLFFCRTRKECVSAMVRRSREVRPEHDVVASSEISCCIDEFAADERKESERRRHCARTSNYDWLSRVNLCQHLRRS